MFDSIRGRIRNDARVRWWYRQNLFVFASADAITGNDALRKAAEPSPSQELEWVYAPLLKQAQDRLARAGRRRSLWARLRG
jgi:hypothetical protein